MTDHPIPLLGKVEARLRLVLSRLSRRWTAVDQHWCDLMEACGYNVDIVGQLRDVTLGGLRESLSAGKWRSYEGQIEETSRRVERLGVPIEEAIAAVGLYGEACGTVLLARGADHHDFHAIDRWVCSTGILVIRGYSQQKASSWRRLDEQERRRLSRDLHDEIGHNLVVLKLYLEMVRTDLSHEADLTAVRRKIEEATDLVGQSVESVRRLMLDLGPAVLEEVGLIRGLRIYAADFTKRTRVNVQVHTRNMPQPLPSSLEAALYRVFQGALSNVVKHSGASHVEVRLRGGGNSVRLAIEDDGAGFDLRDLTEKRTFGLTAMRERVELLGGAFKIASRGSSSKGSLGGTRIEVILPLRASDTGRVKS